MLEFKTHHGRDRVQRMGVRAALPACLAAALAAAGRVPSRWERVPSREFIHVIMCGDFDKNNLFIKEKHKLTS
jgi:hypothetical protein